jgi:hypothetical protein
MLPAPPEEPPEALLPPLASEPPAELVELPPPELPPVTVLDETLLPEVPADPDEDDGELSWEHPVIPKSEAVRRAKFLRRCVMSLSLFGIYIPGRAANSATEGKIRFNARARRVAERSQRSGCEWCLRIRP